MDELGQALARLHAAVRDRQARRSRPAPDPRPWWQALFGGRP